MRTFQIGKDAGNANQTPFILIEFERCRHVGIVLLLLLLLLLGTTECVCFL
jgi:hypothetical protein